MCQKYQQIPAIKNYAKLLSKCIVRTAINAVVLPRILCPNCPRKSCKNRIVQSTLNASYSSSKNVPAINEVVPFSISVHNKCWPYFTVSKCVPAINAPYLHLETHANNLSPWFSCPLKISSSSVLEFVPFSLLELSLIPVSPSQKVKSEVFCLPQPFLSKP